MLLPAALLLLQSICVQAQPGSEACPDALLLQPGMELEYHTFKRGKRKPQLRILHHVTSVAEEKGEPKAQVKCGIYDSDNKLLRSYDYYVVCRKGQPLTDRSVLFDPRDLDVFENKDFRFEGTDIVYPVHIAVGDTIPQARYVVQVISGTVSFAQLITQLVQRKVTSREDVHTPAGTFSCYKIDYVKQRVNISRTISFRTSDRMADFVAPGIGTVRSETYGRFGRLSTYTVLVRKSPEQASQ